MAKLVYSVITSLDGYVVDADGSFEWAAPDAELHTFVNDQERDVGTYLYGRRMYEVMRFWQTASDGPEQPAPMADYARIWRAADKIVYSSTLDDVDTARTRLERSFDPAAVRELVAGAGADISIGGPELAGHALAAGLVDECHLFLHPIVVGGGRHWLPGGLRFDLRLVAERRFTSGVVHLHYQVCTGRG